MPLVKHAFIANIQYLLCVFQDIACGEQRRVLCIFQDTCLEKPLVSHNSPKEGSSKFSREESFVPFKSDYIIFLILTVYGAV